MNKYIPYVWTFTFPDSSKILNNPYLIINTLVILFFLYPIISLKSSKCGDPIISIATKALPGVLAHGDVVAVAVNQFVGKIHIREKRSRLAHLPLLSSSSDTLNRICRDGFAFAHRDLLSHTLVTPLRHETVKRPRTSMGRYRLSALRYVFSRNELLKRDRR